MSLQKSQDRVFVTIDGSIMTSGGSLNLADGQIAVVDNTAKPTQNGKKVLSAFSGLEKDKQFKLQLGKPNVGVSRSITDKAYESIPFTLAEIKDFKVYAPKNKGIKTDEFIIGYNGKAGTEIVLKENTSDVIDITLSGDAMKVLGYAEGMVTVSLYLEYPYLNEDGTCIDCEGGVPTMQEIIEKAVERFKKMTLLGGVPITDYVEVLPVNSLSPSLADISDEVGYTFYSLTLVDRGDFTALGRVQAQYPAYEVKRTDRLGDEQSVYTIVAPTGTSLADYEASLASLIKGCADCPAGYTELEAGIIYSVEIEDDGADLTTTVDDLPGFVTGTVVKVAQVDGVGTYTLVTDDEITDAEIETFKAASAVKGTATITLVGDVVAVCANTTTDDTAWAAGEECVAIPEVYRITLSDDECGEDKLAALSAAYPELTIVIDTANLSRTATLTGTSGTANVNIGGVDYLATFNTSLTQTATDFVTAHEAAIELATGGTLTSAGATLILVAPSATYPDFSITNVTTNLAGTVAAAVGSGAEDSALCQTTYRTTVYSEPVCEECSDEFRDLFATEKPRDYEFVSWVKDAPSYNEDAKMGIKFKGKEFIMSGDEQFRDDMPFYATSTRIAVAGGQPMFINENTTNGNGRFAVKVLSIASEPEAYGGMMRDMEDRSRRYFDGTERLAGNNYGKWAMGHETRLQGTTQYVDFALTVDHYKQVQQIGFVNEKITYHIYAPVGKHTAIEAVLNKLATAAGLPASQAYGNL